MTWEGFVVILISTWDFMHGICCLMIARWKAIEQLRSKILELNRGTPKTCFSHNAAIFSLIISGVLSYFRCVSSVWIGFRSRGAMLSKQSIECLQCQHESSWSPKRFLKFKAPPSFPNPSKPPTMIQFMCISIRKTINPLTFCIRLEQNCIKWFIARAQRDVLHRVQ